MRLFELHRDIDSSAIHGHNGNTRVVWLEDDDYWAGYQSAPVGS